MSLNSQPIQTNSWDKYKVAANKQRNCKVTCESCERILVKANKARHQRICKGLKMIESNRNDVTDDDVQDNYQIRDCDINLQHFKVLPLMELNNDIHINFKAPFTVKVIAPRGGGKTSFVVTYILLNAQHVFRHVYFITSTPKQCLLDSLRNLENVSIGSFDLLDAALVQRNVLIVVDDLMQEIWNSKPLESIYSKGRHKGISLISLEQDTTYSNITERRNVDYIVLFKIRDNTCLSQFYRTYCVDMEYCQFIQFYKFSVRNRGFVIIDFISEYKYRVNSFNYYFSPADSNIYEVIQDSNNVDDVYSLNRCFNDFRHSYNSVSKKKSPRKQKNFNYDYSYM